MGFWCVCFGEALVYLLINCHGWWQLGTGIGDIPGAWAFPWSLKELLVVGAALGSIIFHVQGVI